jgi:hypothetical protein
MAECNPLVEEWIAKAEGGELFFWDAGDALDFQGQLQAYSAISGRRKLPWRYRWPDAVRDDVLARLLALNAERYAEEVAMGLHSKGAKQAAKASRAVGGSAQGARGGADRPRPVRWARLSPCRPSRWGWGCEGLASGTGPISTWHSLHVLLPTLSQSTTEPFKNKPAGSIHGSSSTYRPSSAQHHPRKGIPPEAPLDIKIPIKAEDLLHIQPL